MITSFFGKYRPLSNFWFLKTPVYLTDENGGLTDDIAYITVEHAFQAAKSLDRNDRIAIGERIHEPRDAKTYGHTIQIRADWNNIRKPLMTDLIRQKFTNSRELRTLLLSTGNQELQEGNTWGDTFWGVVNGKGENHLGKILMQIRNELRE